MPQQFDFPRNQLPLKLTPKTVYLILGLLVVLWFASGIYTVAQDEQAVVLRFGKLLEVVDPGLHYRLPSPIDMVSIQSVTNVYREEIGFRTRDPGPPAQYRKMPNEALMLTGGLNIIDVEMVVQYRVSSIVDALFSVRDLGVFERRGRGREPLIHDASETALRQVIGRHAIDEALTEGKVTIQAQIKEQLQETLDKYKCGLTVDSVQLQTVAPPQQVDDAFKDVASAKEDRERRINEARGYQNDIIPKARGEAQKMIKEAEAYTIERVRRAQGDADRFRAVYEEYQKAPDVTETRLYLETMETILPRLKKYIIKSDAKGNLLNILNLEGVNRSGKEVK